MKYAFNDIFCKMIEIYNIEISAVSFEVDRHESRVRHWKKDSLPGKAVFNELFTFFREILSHSVPHKFEELTSYLFEKGYVSIHEIDKANVDTILKVVEKQVKERRLYSSLTIANESDIFDHIDELLRASDFESCILYSENILRDNYRSLSAKSFYKLLYSVAFAEFRLSNDGNDISSLEKAEVILRFIRSAYEGELPYVKKVLLLLSDCLLKLGILKSDIVLSKESVDIQQRLLSLYQDDDRSLEVLKLKNNLASNLINLAQHTAELRYFNRAIAVRDMIENDYADLMNDKEIEHLYVVNLYNKINILSFTINFGSPSDVYQNAIGSYQKMNDMTFSVDANFYLQATLLSLSSISVDYYRYDNNPKHLKTAKIMLQKVEELNIKSSQIRVIHNIYLSYLSCVSLDETNYQQKLEQVERRLEDEELLAALIEVPMTEHFVYISRMYLYAAFYSDDHFDEYVEKYHHYMSKLNLDTMNQAYKFNAKVSEIYQKILSKATEQELLSEINYLSDTMKEYSASSLGYVVTQLLVSKVYQFIELYYGSDYSLEVTIAFDLAKQACSSSVLASIVDSYKQLNYLYKKLTEK